MKQLGKDTAEALSYLMDLRLKAGFRRAEQRAPPKKPNQVDTQSLSTLERDLLKDALQVVKRFKNQMIRHHFPSHGALIDTMLQRFLRARERKRLNQPAIRCAVSSRTPR
jgi:hypothetical protein